LEGLGEKRPGLRGTPGERTKSAGKTKAKLEQKRRVAEVFHTIYWQQNGTKGKTKAFSRYDAALNQLFIMKVVPQ